MDEQTSPTKKKEVVIRVGMIIDKYENGRVENLCLRMGVTLNTGKSWRDGTRRPSVESIEKIFNAYPEITLEDLIWVKEIEPEIKESTLA